MKEFILSKEVPNIEANRQFVIFGPNYTDIGFDDNDILPADVRNQYSFSLSPTPDMPDPTQMQGQIISGNQVAIRPQYISQDKNLRVFFGGHRIHIEELNATTDTYDSFIELATHILSHVASKKKLKVTRLAINSTQFARDTEDAFLKYFCQSDLYSNNPYEWAFRTNAREKCKEIDTEVNKILAVTKTAPHPNTMPPGMPMVNSKPALVVNYDFNTIPEQLKDFNITELTKFAKAASIFRSTIA